MQNCTNRAFSPGATVTSAPLVLRFNAPAQNHLMHTAIKGICSMATRHVLAELAAGFEARSGFAVAFESVGGVDAVRRIQAGEIFDIVVLAADAIDKLAASGHLQAGSRVDLMRSGVAVAVRAGAPLPDISSEDAVRRAVCSAASISVSTGPSGVALAALFRRWGIADEIESRIVQAPPGVPVATLVASGQVELGFQQLSELLPGNGVINCLTKDLTNGVTDGVIKGVISAVTNAVTGGVTVVGPLPPAIQITTTFSAGVPADSSAGLAKAEQVRALIDFMTSAQALQAKRKQGMEAA